MKENSMSFETAKQEVEKIIAEIEERSITHRTFSEECLRKVLFVLLRENQLAKEALKKQCDIADERNQLLKENEELKADNYELNNRINDLLDSIPTQKVQDKIEELKNNKPYLIKFDDWRDKEYTNEDIINNCIDVLQELLEEEDKQ